MPRERYVRPPLVPREAPAAWRAVWPFRLGALLLLVALTLLLVHVYGLLNGGASEDPGLQGGLAPFSGRASSAAR